MFSYPEANATGTPTPPCLDTFLGYDRVYVPLGREEQFDDDEIEQFQAANRWLMQQRQEETDPEDRRRRRYQMQLLEEVKSRFMF